MAQERYRGILAVKGPPLKIGSDFSLAAFIEAKIIKEDYSPAAVASLLAVGGNPIFTTALSSATIYSYIEKGVFLKLTNKNLPFKGKRHRKYHPVRAARPPRGESIENRPIEIAQRITFGHWEMDTVVGRQGTRGSLLVLTERLTRNEIVRPLKAHTAASVVVALDGIERKYGKHFSRVFRSITVDNGTEFSDCCGIERSALHRRKRTDVFYCHPYSSWERGSNEKQNQMLRRRFPKKTDFTKVSNKAVAVGTAWLNNYPRAILGWHSSAQEFNRHLEELGVPLKEF